MGKQAQIKLKDWLARIVGVEVVLIDRIWDDLRALRPFWPVLIPLVLWYARRAYRLERVAAQAAAAALQQAAAESTAGL